MLIHSWQIRSAIKMARFLVSPLMFLLFVVVVLQQACPWVTCDFVFNVTHLADIALAAYEQNFLEVASHVLQKENTTNLFSQSALSSAGSGEGKGESEVVGVDRFKEMMKALLFAIDTRVYGVTGVDLPRRAFAGLYYNSIGENVTGEYTYHLLIDDGYLLDVLNEDMTSVPAAERRLAGVYPWLAVRLLQCNILKVSWCTLLSLGRHRLTHHVKAQNDWNQSNDELYLGCVTSGANQMVQGSNLLVLAVADRGKQGCSERRSAETCTSCPSTGGHGGRLSPCRSCSLNTSRCQCPCFCDVDYNVCRDSYQHLEGANFPMTPCYEEPSMPALTDSGPDRHLPGVPLCGLQCPAFGTREDCRDAADRCRWNDGNVYPVCEPLSTTTATSSPSTPLMHRTTTITSATTQPSAVSATLFWTTSGTFNATEAALKISTDSKSEENSGLSRGAIAGIVTGVVCLVGVLAAAGFKLCRLHHVCKHDGRSNPEIEERFVNTLSDLSQDTVQLTTNPVSSQDIKHHVSCQPTSTDVTSCQATKLSPYKCVTGCDICSNDDF